MQTPDLGDIVCSYKAINDIVKKVSMPTKHAFFDDGFDSEKLDKLMELLCARQSESSSFFAQWNMIPIEHDLNLDKSKRIGNFRANGKIRYETCDDGSIREAWTGGKPVYRDEDIEEAFAGVREIVVHSLVSKVPLRYTLTRDLTAEDFSKIIVDQRSKSETISENELDVDHVFLEGYEVYKHDGAVLVSISWGS